MIPSLRSRCALAAIVLSASAPIEAQRLDWLVHTSSHGSNLRPFMKVDAEGNSILACEYSGGITISGQMNGSLGLEDIVVAKFDPSGTMLWCRHFGNSSDDLISGLGTDGHGNVYLAVHASGFTTSYSAADTVLTIQTSGNRDLLFKLAPDDGRFLAERRSDEGWRFDVEAGDLYAVRGIVPGGLFVEHLDTLLNILSTTSLGTSNWWMRRWM